MTLYMKVDGIEGSVSAAGHEGWIDLHSLDWGINRNASTETGKVNNRIIGIPQFSDVRISKKIDKASPLLFSKACQGAIKGDVVIHACQTGDKPTRYLEYLLSDTLITHFDHQGIGTDAYNELLEALHIHYSKIQMRYTPRGPSHQSDSAFSSGYDLTKAELL